MARRTARPPAPRKPRFEREVLKLLGTIKDLLLIIVFGFAVYMMVDYRHKEIVLSGLLITGVL